MSVSVLSTKFYVPPARENAVARPHLVDKLLSAVNHPGSFTLVSGPAGFGKTTLLSEFVSRLQYPVAWVSLDEGDNDPLQFWTYLIKACRSILEGIGESALELFNTQQALPDDTIPTLLIKDLTANDQSIVLVLDDYQTIQTLSIHKGLQFLLEHLPHNLHMIISTRTDPPWPLARLRASNRLIEIRAQDLRFSIEEAAEFLNLTMGLNLSPEDIAALEERTEGWAAGLQLAALSIQGRSDTPAFVKAFTGSNLYVAEYLVEEVLQRQPGDIREFLLQTSILKRMNAGLCEAVTGCRDGQAILQSLDHANIFIVSLDDEGQWFRYHHLFADLLQSRLRQFFSKDIIVALHRHASIWYELNGFTIETVNHALASKDFERVAKLLKQVARTMIFTGQVNVLRNWLEALPEASFHAHPHLTFYQFWIDLLQRRADLSEQAIREIENLYNMLPSSPENDRLRGELMAVVCRALALSGRTSTVTRLAEEALAYLPSDDLASRARANSALAIAHDLEDHAKEADQAYRECISQAIAAGDSLLVAHTLMAKGLIQYRSGQLQKANMTFQTVIDMKDRAEFAPSEKTETTPLKENRSKKIFFPAGPGYIGLASIHLEMNDLRTAENLLKQGMELCRRGGLDGIFIGRILMSRLRQARGDLDGALKEIQMPTRTFKDNTNIVTRQIQIELAKGDIDGAWSLAAPYVETLINAPDDFRPYLLFIEIPEVSIARVYLAQGKTGKAMQLLDQLQSTNASDKRMERVVAVSLLKALICLKQNDGNITPEAIENFEHALELGVQEGFFLVFLEEGPSMIPLLNDVINRQKVSAQIRKFTRELLDAFAGTAKLTTQPYVSEETGLVEQLTPREMEVLELLNAGDSNQAIAEKLVITVRTVKKHTSNIYGKLSVNSRIQAVARARELGLLPAD